MGSENKLIFCQNCLFGQVATVLDCFQANIRLGEKVFCLYL